MTDTPLVDLIVEEPAWQERLPDLSDAAETGARLAMTGAGLNQQRFALAVLACNDSRITTLNGTFRGVVKPTNVLAWPAFDLAADEAGGEPRRPNCATASVPLHLGDIAIALETTATEANSASLLLKAHVIHLILHGCLHLLGYGHDCASDAERMERIEREQLASIGLHDPYG